MLVQIIEPLMQFKIIWVHVYVTQITLSKKIHVFLIIVMQIVNNAQVFSNISIYFLGPNID